jgi:uncharacterized protein with NAD-binding domain and iron-sulfur cluster
MKKICIIGGGISGLTVSHELSKFPDKYDITIYERKNAIGGLARSSRDSQGCTDQYCWRIFFTFYTNLLKVMSEIPLIENPSKNTLSNLARCSHLNIQEIGNTSLYDDVIAYKNILWGFTSSDERLDQLDNLSWWDALGTTSESNLFRTVAPWLGGSRYDYSYKSAIKVGFEMDILPGYFHPNSSNYVTTKPTSEALFAPWYVHLTNQSVKINLNTSLQSVEVSNNKVISITLDNGERVIADYYVFNLPVEVMSLLIKKTPTFLEYEYFRKIIELEKIALHMQLSFQYYFDRSISLGKGSIGTETNTFLLVDSPWDIIVLQYDKIYKDTKLCEELPNVKGAWSIAVCTFTSPGILYNKPADKCTFDEIKAEIWAQMYTSKALQKIIMKNNGYKLEADMIIKISDLWPTYRYNNGRIETAEPKFVNNAGTGKLRPSFKTPIENMFISTAYTKEGLAIFSMESACIVGKYVSNEICQCNSGPVIISRPKIFAPLRAIDSIFYKMGMPNVLTVIVVIFIVCIVILCFKKLKKL